MKRFFKKINSFILLFLVCASTTQAQDTLFVEAKRWYRDNNRVIRYTDWTKYPSQTLETLRGYKPVQKPKLSKYGGDETHTFKATGYFRTQKEGNRWWIVDPSGCAFITTAINSVRQGKSPNNQSAFSAKYKTTKDWVIELRQIIEENYFSGTGSWSELEVILPYNEANPQNPIVYTTQLSFLANYAQKKKQKDINPLAWIFDPGFPKFCDEHAAKNAVKYRNDPNLLGHFSDNELDFTQKSIEEIWDSTKDTASAHRALADFLKEKNVDNPKALSTADADYFMGKITALYYKTVSEALKKHDPNHLYLGSRLHTSAKFNRFIFTEGVEKYIDMVSINYYGYWQPQQKHHEDWAKWTTKPFFITEFYTKGDDVGMKNISGAGWLVRTQADRGIHYQNFCLQLLKAPNCVGWHWFRYQDNDPNDPSADPSNQDSNKGFVNTEYEVYKALAEKMKELNRNKYNLVKFFEKQ